MQTVTSADGTEIAYDRHGEGPPLVLLHGDATREFWDPLVPRFADDFTVVVPDRRGRGDSGDEATDDEYSLQREVEDARAVVEALDADPAVTAPPVLFGHSFGGLQALELARADDVNLAGVVAYEPSIIVGEYRESADLADRMEAALDAGEPGEAAKHHIREVLHGGDVGDEAFEQWLQGWPLWPEYARFAENLYRMDRAIERYDLPETLDVDAPTLLLTGTEGPSHLRDSVRAVDDALPESRLVEFDGVSHAGPVEAPDRVVVEVREFIGTLSTHADAAEAGDDGAVMQTATSADDTEIAYEQHGEGPPLVLLHGSSATSNSWNPVVPHLADDFTVVVPDRRGRGESGEADEYSLDREVDDLRAVLDALVAGPAFDADPTVVGHSYGGLVALAAALDGFADGEQALPVERLALYEPSILVGEHADDDLADRLAARLDEGDRLGALRLFVEEGGGVPDVERLPWWPERADVHLVDTVVRESYAVEGFDVPAYPEIGVPTLLLTGERGPAHLKAGVAELDDRLPDSDLVELDGVGHMANATAPRDLAAVIRDFALESPASEV